MENKYQTYQEFLEIKKGKGCSGCVPSLDAYISSLPCGLTTEKYIELGVPADLLDDYHEWIFKSFMGGHSL